MKYYLPEEAFKDERLINYSKILLMYLFSHDDGNGVGFSTEYMQEAIKVKSNAHFTRLLRDLKKYNYVNVIGYSTNRRIYINKKYLD